MAVIDGEFLRRDDVVRAVGEELSWRGRLLPRRADFELLSRNPSAVADWLIPHLRSGGGGRRASVVFADKEWRGTRPLHTLTLEDSVLYRVLSHRMSTRLPERLRVRGPIDEFRRAPLAVAETKYVCVTDVTAYYEFVDHDLLATELIGQTGDQLAVNALRDLLVAVLGRHVGLPQVHAASDIFGDVYIDPVRRRLLRRGHAAFTYSDDFRIAAPTLQGAQNALEACEIEVRALGLVLNETKTRTYFVDNYTSSLTAFNDAQQRLLDSDGEGESGVDLGLLERGYESGEVEPASGDESESKGSDDERQRRLTAARRAFELWRDMIFDEDINDRDAAILRDLLGRSLPVLGAAGDTGPLKWIETIVRIEPALTPQAALYLKEFGQSGEGQRSTLRATLDNIVSKDILSTWQSLWFAHVAADSGMDETPRPYEEWLQGCVIAGDPAVAATAAAALGQIGRGNADDVAAAIDRVGPEWRRLAFVGLIGLDRAKAEATADDALDRLLLTEDERL